MPKPIPYDFSQTDQKIIHVILVTGKPNPVHTSDTLNGCVYRPIAIRQKPSGEIYSEYFFYAIDEAVKSYYPENYSWGNSGIIAKTGAKAFEVLKAVVGEGMASQP